MIDLKICRICLCKNVKMYNYDQCNLKQYYEQILATKVNYKDGLPHYFCYMCATMLYKFHRFKEKCHIGQKTLNELLWSGTLTLTSLSIIDRQSKNLKSPIDIIQVSKTVKTYNLKHVPVPKSVTKDKDNSLSSENKSEIKSEMFDSETETSDDNEVKIDYEDICIEEKMFPDFEDDRMFTEDEDLNTENVNIIDKSAVKEEESNNQMAVDDEKISLSSREKTVKDNEKKNVNLVDKIVFEEEEPNNQMAVDDEKISLSSRGKTVRDKEKQKKQKKTKVNKSLAKEKGKKFDVSTTKKNDLDPDYWLKINLNEQAAFEELRAKAKDPKYLSAAYKCTGCVKGFSKEDMLNRHIKLRHSESLGSVVCRFCSMRFKWKSRLTKHITQHYVKYKCLRCNLICTLKDTALSHNAFHNGVIRECTHCGEIFRHSSTYYSHLRTHRSEHVCKVCGASFISVIGLMIHKRIHITTVISPEEEVSTYCERCDIKFETRNAYEQHLSHSIMHADSTGEPANDTPAPSTLKKRKKKGQRNPRRLSTCSICNKTMPSYTAYMRHHAAEHKNKPFPKDRHICEICGASILATSVASHLNTHTLAKIYPCDICGMQFNLKRTMTRHQVTHTGEKPYGCSQCDKRFTQLGSMKLHYRTFHLKEPYPKRNKRKKVGNDEDSQDIFKFDKSR